MCLTETGFFQNQQDMKTRSRSSSKQGDNAVQVDAAGHSRLQGGDEGTGELRSQFQIFRSLLPPRMDRIRNSRQYQGIKGKLAKCLKREDVRNEIITRSKSNSQTKTQETGQEASTHANNAKSNAQQTPSSSHMANSDETTHVSIQELLKPENRWRPLRDILGVDVNALPTTTQKSPFFKLGHPQEIHQGLSKYVSMQYPNAIDSPDSSSSRSEQVEEPPQGLSKYIRMHYPDALASLNSSPSRSEQVEEPPQGLSKYIRMHYPDAIASLDSSPSRSEQVEEPPQGLTRYIRMLYPEADIPGASSSLSQSSHSAFMPNDKPETKLRIKIVLPRLESKSRSRTISTLSTTSTSTNRDSDESSQVTDSDDSSNHS